MTQIIGSNGIRVKAKTIFFDNIIYTSKSEVDVQIYSQFFENNVSNSTYIESIYSIQSTPEDSTFVGTVNNDYEILSIGKSFQTEYLATELLNSLNSVSDDNSFFEVFLPMLEKQIFRKDKGFFSNVGTLSYNDAKQYYRQIIESLTKYGNDSEVLINSLNKLRTIGADGLIDVVVAASNYIEENLSIFTINEKLNSKLIEDVIVPSVLLSTSPKDFLKRAKSLIEKSGEYTLESQLFSIGNKFSDYLKSSEPLFQGTLDTVLESSTLIKEIDSFLQRDDLLIISSDNDYLRKTDLHEIIDSGFDSGKDLIIQGDSGLIQIRESTKTTYIQPMVIGPPDKTFVPISGIHRFNPLHVKMDYIVGPTDKTFEENLQFSKLNEYEVDYSPYLKEEEEKTFLHKLFFLDLDNMTQNENMVPAVYTQPYSYFVNDESYVNLPTQYTDINIFKFKMVEEVFRASLKGIESHYPVQKPTYEGIQSQYPVQKPTYEGIQSQYPVQKPTYEGIQSQYPIQKAKYESVQSQYPKFGQRFSTAQISDFVVFGKSSGKYSGNQVVYESTPFFVFDLFVGQTYYHNVKSLPNFEPMKIQSSIGRIKSGGSEAYGHEAVNLPKLYYGHHFVPMEYIKTSTMSTSEIKYEITLTLGEDDPLYEFEFVNFNMNTGSKNGKGIEAGRYIWSYEFLSDNRLLECLTLTTDGRLTGQISDMDIFLNKYATENWVTDEGHHPPIDLDWTDFDMKTPRTFKYKILASAISRGIIQIVEPDDAVLPSFGDTVEQHNSTTGVTSRARISSSPTGPELFPVIFNSNQSPVIKNVWTFEVEVDRNFDFDFEQYTETSEYDLTAIQAEIVATNKRDEIQQELNNTTDQVLIEILQEQIDSLNEQINQLAAYSYLVITDTNFVVEQKYITNIEDDRQYLLFNFEQDGTGGLKKEINFELKVHNNYSFDRDLWLHTNKVKPEEQTLPDTQLGYWEGEILTRTEKIKKLREAGYGRFNNDLNKTEMENSKVELQELYDLGQLNMTKEEFDILLLEMSLGNVAVSSIEAERLENIEPLLLNCAIRPDSESAYYQQVTDILVTTRGYSAYAKCK